MTLNYVALTVTEQDAGQDAGTGCGDRLMTCLTCGCPAATHRHHNRATYCGRAHDEPCNAYRPRRERWWQIWRPL